MRRNINLLNSLKHIASNQWLANIISIIILLLTGNIIFVLLSGGTVLESTLLGFHIKISLRHITNPTMFLVILTIFRFYLWRSQVRILQDLNGDKKQGKEKNKPHSAFEKTSGTNIVTQVNSYSKGSILTMTLVLLITFIVCNWLYTIYLTQTSGILLWDMAEHSFLGVKIAEDIEQLDIKSLFIHTHEQRLWPFVHSYLLAGFYLLFGTSADTATLLSICAFFLLVLFLYLTSLNLSKKEGWFIGILACFMALTSKLHLIYSTLIMLEIFGALFALIALFLYFKAIESCRDKYYFLTSIAVTLLFLTKYNYGFFVIATILLTEYKNIPDKHLIWNMLVSFIKALFFIKNSKKVHISLKPVFPSYFYFLFVPAVLIILIWFIYPYPHKINSFLSFAIKSEWVSQVPKDPLFSLNNFLAYPEIIMNYFSISKTIFIVTAALYVTSFFGTKDIKIKVLRNYVLIGLLFSTLHSLKFPRNMITILPPYWIVAAYQANKLITGIKLGIFNKNSFFTKLIFLALIAIFSYSGIVSYRTSLPSNIEVHFSEKELTNVFNYLAKNTNKKSNLFFFGSFNELAPDLINWELSVKRGFKHENIKIDLKRFDRESYYHDPSKMPLTYRNEFNKWLDNPGPDYVITIELLDGSKYSSSHDYYVWNKWKMNYIYLMKNTQQKYSIFSEKSFDNPGLHITIYKNNVT